MQVRRLSCRQFRGCSAIWLQLLRKPGHCRPSSSLLPTKNMRYRVFASRLALFVHTLSQSFAELPALGVPFSPSISRGPFFRRLSPLRNLLNASAAHLAWTSFYILCPASSTTTTLTPVAFASSIPPDGPCGVVLRSDEDIKPFPLH